MVYEWPEVHGGLNQEKYSKSCLGLGPIFFESTTPEVFKNTFREIADFHPIETLQWTKHIDFVKHKPKKNIELTLILMDHLNNKFSFLAF